MSVKIKNLSKKLLTIAIMMSLILSGTMMLQSKSCLAATNVVSSFEVFPTYTKNADGTITVRVRVNGDMSMFDVGVVYDNTKLKVEDYGFSNTFSKKYSQGIKICSDIDTHVVFGGVTMDDGPFSYNGELLTVTFSLKGSNPGTVMIVMDSASYDHDFSNAASAPGTKVLKLN